MRIVSLLSSATEMLFGLGLGGQVLAVSHECDWPPAAQRLPKATRSLVDSSQSSGQIDEQVKQLMESGAALYQIDRELLAELRPDLIVTQAQCDVCAVRYQDVLDLVAAEAALRQTRVVSLNPLSLGEILSDIERIGEATGATSEASEYVGSLRRRVASVREKAERIPVHPRPRVVCLEWLDPLMAAGNWTPELIELAGGQSGLAVRGKHSGYVTWEQVVAYNPEVLLVAPCGFDLERTLVEARRLPEQPGYQGLAAVRGGQVVAIDGNAYLNRSGPRIVDSLEILAHLLHPNAFGPPQGMPAGRQPWQCLSR